MNPLLPFLMTKLAAEEPKITKSELKMINKELKSITPTKADESIAKLVGKPQTKRQMVRNAAIGAALSVGSTALGNLIEGDKTRPIMTPRGALRSAVMGITFSAAVPAMKRWVDIEAAKRGKF